MFSAIDATPGVASPPTAGPPSPPSPGGAAPSDTAGNRAASGTAGEKTAKDTTATKTPRPQRPLAVRLAVIIACLIVGGLAAAGTATVVLLRHSLIVQKDQQLESQIRSLSPEQLSGMRQTGPTQYSVYRFRPDGTLDWGLTTVGNDPGIETFTPDQTIARNGEAFTVTGPNGKYRALALLIQDSRSGDLYTVLLSLPLADVDATIRQMVFRIIWITLSGALIATAVGYGMVRRSLRPLKAVEESAAAIAAGDLSQRVPDAAPGTEVGSLTTSLNAMLAQIETAFDARQASEQRMRRFVSDASHELRTPLATLRGYAELYRMGGLEEDADVAGAMNRIETEAKRMGLLVGDLLTLTRLDEGRPLLREPVDLMVLAGDGAADTLALDPSRQVQVVTEGAAGADVMVKGDEAALRQVIANLIGNAVRHTPSGTPVELVVGAGTAPEIPDGPAVWLEVRDHGPGIPPEQAARVFERFYRLDQSRSRGSGGGSGLGLAIVASIVQAHGGVVSVGPTAGGGATFRVALPGIGPTLAK
ncbi:MAG: HAMP domain-containing protein [Bifidobacteriaceae bacterium]|jgi:two-component system OmpR family sensor kinase|nr:HAMP domain-containing protein [Bifidobacteriaceae bacterium]